MKTMRLLLAIAVVVMLVATITVAQAPPAGAGGQQPGQGRGGRGGRGGGGIPMPLVITTMAWTDGGEIPAKYAGAMGVSPALSWTGAPMGTQSFLLIMHDMDVAPGRGAEDVLHWIIWDIPGSATGLSEGLKPGDQADGSRMGRNIAGQNSYFGPAPPAGHPIHHYVLELYALDAKLNLPPTAARADVMGALTNHVIARGAYYGKFKPQ